MDARLLAVAIWVSGTDHSNSADCRVEQRKHGDDAPAVSRTGLERSTVPPSYTGPHFTQKNATNPLWQNFISVYAIQYLAGFCQNVLGLFRVNFLRGIVMKGVVTSRPDGMCIGSVVSENPMSGQDLNAGK
jgi:hypothetical protein